MRQRVVGGLAGLVLAVGVLTGCAGRAGSSDGSGHDDADVAFATAMVPHHAQGIAMARLAAGRTGSADVAGLARQIAAEQVPEIVQMQDLLSDWGRPAAPTTAGMPATAGMDGMDGAADAALSTAGPGMMTDRQMQDLSNASGPAFDRLFLEMMLKHDGAGVAMARTELSDGENADAQQLAQNISDSQQLQTTFLLQMLAGR